MSCTIDWAAFGLEPEPCSGGYPAFTVSQVCVHEHVTQSIACAGCADAMIHFDDPGDWWCTRCLVAGHPCAAPLQVVRLG
jgi:hypothetical protein